MILTRRDLGKMALAALPAARLLAKTNSNFGGVQAQLDRTEVELDHRIQALVAAVIRSLDAANTSVRATSSAHIRSKTSGVQRPVTSSSPAVPAAAGPPSRSGSPSRPRTRGSR